MASFFIVCAVIAGVLIVAILVAAAMKPDMFRIQRTAVIAAPAEAVFAQLSDFRRWAGWSPWEKMDPAMQRTHRGASSGVGAAYAWEGNKKVGQGSMEITEATPHSKVALKLDFIKPFKAHNTVTFTLTPQEAGGTLVTWMMEGPLPFWAKVMHTVINVDRMVGRDFEKGLADLKAIAESHSGAAQLEAAP